MSETSSQTSDQAREIRAIRIRAILWAVAGLAIVGAALYINFHFDVGAKLQVDVMGRSVQGRAERTDDGQWRLRYEDPYNGIFASSYDGGFGFHRYKGDTFVLPLKVSKDDAKQFQPAGASYPAAIPMVILFIAGMACILHARHTVIRRTRPVRLPKGKKKRP